MQRHCLVVAASVELSLAFPKSLLFGIWIELRTLRFPGRCWAPELHSPMFLCLAPPQGAPSSVHWLKSGLKLLDRLL